MGKNIDIDDCRVYMFKTSMKSPTAALIIK